MGSRRTDPRLWKNPVQLPKREEPVDTSTLAKSFVAFFAEVENVLKDAKNPFFGSEYATLGAVLDTIKPVLRSHKLAIMQVVKRDPTGTVLLTKLVHESGEMLDAGEYPLLPVKQDPQGLGSAITYARRYSLAALCGIAQEDDDGNAASKPVSKPAPRQQQAAPHAATPAPRPAPVAQPVAKGDGCYRAPAALDGTDLAGVVMSLPVGDPTTQVMLTAKKPVTRKAANELSDVDVAQFYKLAVWRYDAWVMKAKSEEEKQKSLAALKTELAGVLQAQADMDNAADKH